MIGNDEHQIDSHQSGSQDQRSATFNNDLESEILVGASGLVLQAPPEGNESDSDDEMINPHQEGSSAHEAWAVNKKKLKRKREREPIVEKTMAPGSLIDERQHSMPHSIHKKGATSALMLRASEAGSETSKEEMSSLVDRTEEILHGKQLVRANAQALHVKELVRLALEDFGIKYKIEVANMVKDQLSQLFCPELLEELQDELVRAESNVLKLTDELVEMKREWIANLHSVRSAIECAEVEIKWTNDHLIAIVVAMEDLAEKQMRGLPFVEHTKE